MRKIGPSLFFLLVLSVLNGFELHAQVIPNSSTAPSSVSNVHSVPSAYSSSMKVNYIRIWEASKPLTTQSSVTDTTKTIQEVKKTTQYFDGLDRPLQTVVKQGSPLGNDMVIPCVYDDLSREVYKYSPYVQISSNTTDGKFKLDPFNNQASFYGNTTYNPGFTGEQVYYARTVYESSALNRVDSVYAQGNSWGGSNRGIATAYLINPAADSVRIWNIDTASSKTPTSTAYYGADQLYKIVTTDEQGNQTIEYRDKDAQVILKKVQISSSPSTHHVGWLCTYYIYDDLHNLRFVVQPQGTEVLRNRGWVFESTSWTGSTIAKELCFSYDYDDRKRMVIKRIPGSGEAWMVYDARDRMVMMQDSVLRQLGKWHYTIYDQLNRDSITGLWTEADNRVYHQAQALNSTSYPAPPNNFEVLTQKYYDDYSWVSGTGSGLSATFISTYASNTSYFFTPDNTTFPYPQSITPLYITRGMLTGVKAKILGTSNYLYSVTFFDDRGRIIQTQSTNYSGGTDTLTNQYSFSGKLLRSLLCHKKSGTNTQGYIVLTKTDYDAMGRLTKVSKKINNSPETVITENTFDELGQLQKKKLGRQRDNTNQNTYTSNAIDSLQYVYNIRGWLRGINKDYARAVGGASGWFGMELTYDFGFTQSQFNGNIAGIRWRSKGDGEQRAYGFTYDLANRFTQGDFTQFTSSSWNTSAHVDYTVKDMSYDLNGNILSMTQKGLKLNSSSVIDSLAYGYNTNSNRLLYVTDRVNDSTSKLGDFKEYSNNTSQDYSYDGNGNLIADNNKRITNITYNHLNLPQTIAINGKGTITYTYDATGSKLQKQTLDSTTGGVPKTTTTVYIECFIYQNDTLQIVNHEEGRARPKRPNFSDTMYYDFFEKDHLGDIRTVLTDELQTDMYPPATMEFVDSVRDNTYYSNINLTRNGLPPGYPTDTSVSNPNTYVAKVNGSGNKIGPGIILKVMSGDKFNVQVRSWYKLNGVIPGTPVSPLSAIESVLINFVPGVSGGKVASGNLNSTLLDPSVTSFLNSRDSGYSTAKPKAYLNWILFDEQFNPVITYDGNNSGFDPVGTDQQFKLHVFANEAITHNGYLYIYVSNETPNVDVYFDNLQVTQIRGPLLEETHYYPFGLTMAGISSKALKTNYPENKFKFNKGSELQSKEFSDGSGLELYETTLRSLDPQLGRWWQIDPKPDFGQSLYSAMDNNPILFNDPLGDIVIGLNESSATEVTKVIHNQFKSQDAQAASKLFKVSKDGLSLDHIDKKEGRQAVAQIKDKNLRSLARGYIKAVNSSTKHFVSFINKDEKTAKIDSRSTISKVLREYANNTTPILEKLGGAISQQDPSTNQTISIIVTNSANSQIVDNRTFDGDKPGAITMPSVAELLAHELIGHNVAWAESSPNYRTTDAIQVTNIYRRATGSKYYRTGLAHEGARQMSQKEANQTPSYLKEE